MGWEYRLDKKSALDIFLIFQLVTEGQALVEEFTLVYSARGSAP